MVCHVPHRISTSVQSPKAKGKEKRNSSGKHVHGHCHADSRSRRARKGLNQIQTGNTMGTPSPFSAEPRAGGTFSAPSGAPRSSGTASRLFRLTCELISTNRVTMRPKHNTLTPQELEIMKLVWQRCAATIGPIILAKKFFARCSGSIPPLPGSSRAPVSHASRSWTWKWLSSQMVEERTSKPRSSSPVAALPRRPCPPRHSSPSVSSSSGSYSC